MSHARSSESVQLSLKHGIEFLNHCEFADDHTINMLEEHRDRVFLAPAFGLLHNTLYEAAPWGITPEKAAGLLTPLAANNPSPRRHRHSSVAGTEMTPYVVNCFYPPRTRARVDDLLLDLRKSFADSYRVDGELLGGGMSRLFMATLGCRLACARMML